MTNIHLDDAKLAELTQAAIFEFLTPEKKDALVRDAIAALLEKPSGSSYSSSSYGRMTRLQQAFAQSITEIAQKEVARLMLNDARIRAQVTELVRKSLSDALDSPGLAYNLGEAIAKVLAGPR